MIIAVIVLVNHKGKKLALYTDETKETASRKKKRIK